MWFRLLLKLFKEYMFSFKVEQNNAYWSSVVLEWTPAELESTPEVEKYDGMLCTISESTLTELGLTLIGKLEK